MNLMSDKSNKPETMKKLLQFAFVCVLLISTNNIIAQTFSYSYDAAGNRIERVIVLLKSKVVGDPVSKQEKEVITDETFETQVIKIYPNPTRGLLELEIPFDNENPSKIRVTVHNMNGSLLINKEQEQSRTQLDLSQFPNGMYILNIIKGDVRSQWKVIKQ